jgi:hypothetical protein
MPVLYKFIPETPGSLALNIIVDRGELINRNKKKLVLYQVRYFYVDLKHQVVLMP